MAVVRDVFLRNLDKRAGAEPRPPNRPALERAVAILRQSGGDDTILARIAREALEDANARAA